MMEAAGLGETFISANPHGVISHDTVTFTITAVRISELTLKPLITQFFAEFLCAGMDEPGFEARQRKDIFFLHFETSKSAVWGPHSLLLSGYRCSFVQVRRPGREVDISHPSSAEVKNEWS
jgi:hypothetical protein